jgi:hypothetical protein
VQQADAQSDPLQHVLTASDRPRPYSRGESLLSGAMDIVADRPSKRARRASVPQAGQGAGPSPSRAPRGKGRKSVGIDDKTKTPPKAMAQKKGAKGKGGKGTPRRSGRSHKTQSGSLALNWDDYEEFEDGVGDARDASKSFSEEEYDEDDFEDDAVDPDVSEDEDFVECALGLLALGAIVHNVLCVVPSSEV